jgi:DNA-binding HxlR family transcriptional regulator
VSDVASKTCYGGCPIEATLRVIGGKWKPVILWFLGNEGTMRFSELRRAVPLATQKMLTQHLRELEADGLVHREVYPQVPPKVEYSLTELGRSLAPALSAMSEWGQRYRAAAHGVAAGADVRR